MHPGKHSRLPVSPLDRASTGLPRKHPRVSVIAAITAAAGTLGTAGFAVGATPWAQAFDNMTKTAQSGHRSTSGQQGDFLFNVIADAKVARPAAAGQLDVVHTAATAGKAGAKQQATTATAGVKALAAKQQPAKTQPAAKAQPAKGQPAKPRLAKPQPPAATAKPYLIYDSVAPGAIPVGRAAAVYANGAYKASPGQLAGHHSVLWIDTNGSDPAANVLDVEPGDATPARAARWVKQRLGSRPHAVAIVYTMRNDWQQVKDNVAVLPAWMQSRVRYWIADPTGAPHVLSGASATQWYWGNSYDITTAIPGFRH